MHRALHPWGAASVPGETTGTDFVRLGAGWCAGRDVANETVAHGLATTGGIVSHTCVAGLTHGLTVDNLLAVNVVTAEVELMHASEDEYTTRSGHCEAAAATSP